MKNTIKTITLPTLLFISLPSASVYAQAKPFTAAPNTPPHYYQIHVGQNVQQFNGEFVQRLIQQLDNATTRNCLAPLKSASITIETYSEGSVVTRAGGCSSAPAQTNQSGAVTGKVTISATRILALILVDQRFNQQLFFKRNDRDLSKYDVNIYDELGKIHVSFIPLPGAANRFVAGCPRTGPIAATYLVDPQTLGVTLGNMAC